VNHTNARGRTRIDYDSVLIVSVYIFRFHIYIYVYTQVRLSVVGVRGGRGGNYVCPLVDRVRRAITCLILNANANLRMVFIPRGSHLHTAYIVIIINFVVYIVFPVPFSRLFLTY
jgi:hypothetical protein